MFIGYNNQKVDVVEKPVIPNFTNVTQLSPPIPFESVRIDIFDDLTCTECDDFILNTLPKIKNLEQETENINLHLYFIPDINNEIYYMAAISLKCASDQGQYWGMLTKLHENKNDLNKKSFMQFGKELELNTDALQECIKEDVYKNAVEDDVKYASEKNITLKPSLLINEYYLIGNQPFENIQKIIDKSLKKITVKKPLPVSTTPIKTPLTEEIKNAEANPVPTDNSAEKPISAPNLSQ